MIILAMEGHFLLADDFSGGLAKALRDLADFVEKDQEPIEATAACFATTGMNYGGFNYNIGLGYRFHGRTALLEYEKEKGWSRRELQLKGAEHYPQDPPHWIK